ncbi:MAG: protein kinase [Verrucomicrobiales bacterium]|nr:protein kinase [Verrucomicrobiales bacterium]
MPEENQSLEEILFDLAVQKPTAEERAAFLDNVCRDHPGLRAQLGALLEGHFGAAGFLPKPVAVEPAPLTGATPAPAETAAPRLGRYKLLEKIGEGGFGEVWMAEQREPVKRRVALKIIKPGMDSRQVVARFEAERQALAMMDHPNIAKIFDAGMTEDDRSADFSPQDRSSASAAPQVSDAPHGPPPLRDESRAPIRGGRPYFVMELVRGTKITDYCDQNALPTRDRLTLFIQVCQAIQHAHQKGIIHRDIKPSNILVTLHDGVPVPKVIDFGIAKATHQDLTDKTVFTQFQQFVGTPAYISPEQAEMSGLDVDTRADIYSLGVLLYELLVGQTPFDPKEMMKGGLDALRQIIREKEPLKPSTRLKTLPVVEVTTTAQRRQTDPLRLAHQLRGDLDWIVMKCLEKDRTRRYETANGLAMDLRRHLSCEPVLARPPSAAYRLQKTWQRHRGVFMAGCLVAVALVAGTGVSWWQAIQAGQSRVAAEAAGRAEAVQRRAAQAALQQEVVERRRAEASEHVARELLYVASLNLIRQAWEENHLGRIRELLEQTAGSTARGFEWYYWQRQAHLDRKTFWGHSARLWSAAFSPDGRRMVSASEDGTAKVWDLATGQELLTLVGHEDSVRSAAWSPDGSQIVTGSKDYVARIWDAATGREIRRLGGHRAAIRAVAFSPDGQRIVTASQDATARVWEAATGRQVLTLQGHSNWVFSAAYSPDGRRIVTGGDDRTARIWDAADGRELRRLTGHQGRVRSAAFSPDSRQVVTASQDQTARVWDAEDGRLQATLSGHRGYVFSARFSPDGRQVVTAGVDHTARLWDASNGRPLNQFKGHGSEVYTAVFSRDGREVLTASDDRTAKLWDTASPPDAARLEYGGKVLAVAVAPDSQRVAAGGEGGAIKLWSATGGGLLLTIPSTGSEVRSLAYSPDGERLVAGHGDGRARIWLAATGRWLRTLPGHVGGVNAAGFSADGRQVLTAGSEGRVKLWDADDGRELLSIPRAQGQTFSTSLSPDGSRIVSGFETGVRVFDAQTGTALPARLDSPHRIRSVSFSPDGRWILSAGEDKAAQVWDASNGTPRLTLAGHTLGVVAAGYSPDGRRIVTGSLDLSARVWEATTGQELLSLRGHEAEVYATAFSPDGRQVVTGSLDGTVRVWTAALPSEVAIWEQERRDVSNRLSAVRARPMWMAGWGPFETTPPPGLITRWLGLAPIDIPAGDTATALDREHLPDEAHVQPRAGERVQANGKELTWEPLEQAGALLDFNALVGRASSPDSVAYVVCYLVSESPRSDLVFKIVSDDAGKVYLNGRPIHRSGPDRSYVLAEETVDSVELKAGTNTLVFKVLNHTERWFGSLRVLAPGGQVVPTLRVTLEPGAAR